MDGGKVVDGGSAQDIARFFDREACCAASSRLQRGSAPGLTGVSRTLIDLIDQLGLRGRTLLDVGCGQGALVIAAGQRGAGAATGIDLSAGSVAAAEQAAERAGVVARFRTGDAAAVTLERHDVVVLNKVVCCYFDPAALLVNVLPATDSYLVMSRPHSRGWRGLIARAAVAAENGWRRLRGDPFRAFVHDGATIDGRIIAAGFAPRAVRSHWTWHVTVFERSESAAG